MNQLTEKVFYIGVNDHDIDLFEGQYIVPNGMAYNSYLIKDEKSCVMDAVDIHKAEEWLANIEEVLEEKARIILWFSIWSRITQVRSRSLRRSIRRQKLFPIKKPSL